MKPELRKRRQKKSLYNNAYKPEYAIRLYIKRNPNESGGSYKDPGIRVYRYMRLSKIQKITLAILRSRDSHRGQGTRQWYRLRDTEKDGNRDDGIKDLARLYMERLYTGGESDPIVREVKLRDAGRWDYFRKRKVIGLDQRGKPRFGETLWDTSFGKSVSNLIVKNLLEVVRERNRHIYEVRLTEEGEGIEIRGFNKLLDVIGV